MDPNAFVMVSNCGVRLRFSMSADMDRDDDDDDVCRTATAATFVDGPVVNADAAVTSMIARRNMDDLFMMELQGGIVSIFSGLGDYCSIMIVGVQYGVRSKETFHSY